VPVIKLKGLNRVRKKLRDGSSIVYWYAWKGGPRLDGEPGTPEFIASFAAAVQARKAPRNDTLAGLVAEYRASPEFAKLAASTRAEWTRWLDRIAETTGDLAIGALPVPALDDRRVKAELRDWRDQWAATPRTADYAMQVLSKVIAHAVAAGKLATNHAVGLGQLYQNDRADQIWTAPEVARFQAAAKSAQIADALRLACLTGLRREDLVRLQWSHVGELAIVIPTGKSRGRKTVVVPLIPEARALLDEIKERQAARWNAIAAERKRLGKPEPAVCLTVLSTAKSCRPWSVNGLGHSINDTKTTAGIDKHLHDARGTFATFLRSKGLKASEIADILGWEESRVERLLATYVDRDSIVLALAARLNRNE
jgi:integrase